MKDKILEVICSGANKEKIKALIMLIRYNILDRVNQSLQKSKNFMIKAFISFPLHKIK
jgi:hypothetical protein